LREKKHFAVIGRDLDSTIGHGTSVGAPGGSEMFGCDDSCCCVIVGYEEFE